MKRTKIILTMIIFLTIIISAKEYRYSIGQCDVIENALGDIIDIEIIYNGSIKRSDIYLHFGRNGWQDIKDIHGYRNSFMFRVSRDTISLEMCFYSADGIWDNNYGQDYRINLRGFLPDSVISSLGDSLSKYDLIKERYQRIRQSIYYLEQIQRSDDQSRQLRVLYELKNVAEQILPEIMRVKDIKKGSDLEQRYTEFLIKTDCL
ncbi:MAG: hypothetical protein C0601_07170 [Candidatus Muiribacterium halophilum]|uniref:Uncharacterized protein n=1 Tax=Muiribacterium halophilum TaxID=2053465 RepID=A0A2N5ZFW3_MUIH1|nr:MAG: hypothetical protein C0601_07170 [Candidatus Muirbacterium halophilum]